VYASSPIDNLLVRLDGVKQMGRGWIAKCPGHEDRTASLSIAASDDGRVLLHCFAGCAAANVLAAVGLSLADLFPNRPRADMTFAERAAAREYAKQARWAAALNVIGPEAKIIITAGRELKAGQLLDAADERRVDEALIRIDAAREVLCGKY
jgi:DNA primase